MAIKIIEVKDIEPMPKREMAYKPTSWLLRDYVLACNYKPLEGDPFQILLISSVNPIVYFEHFKDIADMHEMKDFYMSLGVKVLKWHPEYGSYNVDIEPEEIHHYSQIARDMGWPK